MTRFIDTTDWPIVRLTMPDQIPDTEAASYLAQLEAVYDRCEPFVLIMGGTELPRHSPGFMKAFAEWSMTNLEQQRLYCRGAVRVEPAADLRQAYKARAEQALKAGVQPYPYEIVDTEAAAQAQAAAWLGTIS